MCEKNKIQRLYKPSKIRNKNGIKSRKKLEMGLV